MTEENQLNENVKDRIISSEQRSLDYLMVPYDIRGTQAHTVMLIESGIVSDRDGQAILRALEEIRDEWDEGRYEIDPELGAHLSLEQAIEDRIGAEAAGSVHTARSRNDQVMVTEQMYFREQVLDRLEDLVSVLAALLEQARKHRDTVFPGYTHMRPARPTTFGHWCLALFDGLCRGWKRLRGVYDRYNQSPLGAVESYGTTWNIDRDRTAELLGFEGVWELPQDAITSRGMFQLNLLGALHEISVVAGRGVSDLLLYTTDEFNYVELGKKVSRQMNPATGSSVMAQKKNPDALELIRATVPRLAGLHRTAAGVLSDLPTGYNRDSRETKELAVQGLEQIEDLLNTFFPTIKTIKVNEDRARSAVVDQYALTTDLADVLSQNHDLPYRTTYRILGNLVQDLREEDRSLQDLTAEEVAEQARELNVDLDPKSEEMDLADHPERVLDERSHVGGTKPEEVDRLLTERSNQLDKLKEQIEKRREQVATSFRKLQETVHKIIKEED